MNPEDPTPHLEGYSTYEEACREFRLNIPEHFNIATAICRRHTDAVTRVALREVRSAASNTYTFGALDYLSDKFATALRDSGIAEGDVVAVMLGQSAALPVAHFGALKLGAIVQPLKVSVDLTVTRTLLEGSKARAIVVDEETRNSLSQIPGSVIAFVASDNIHSHVVAAQDKSFWREIYEASADFRPAETHSNSPAFIFSTPAESGSVKSLSHSHAALIGNLPAFEMANNFDLGPDAVLWTSTDWASIGTILGAIFPAWYYGMAVIAQDRSSFNTADVFRLIKGCGITVALLPSSQLETLKSADTERKKPDFKLKRLITSEAPAPETAEWVRTALAASLDTAHITLEAGAFAATCQRWFPLREGSAGKVVPGRAVEILDVSGQPLPSRERGRIAIALPDQALICEYPEHSMKNSAGLEGSWYVSEEFGLKDPDGYLVVAP